MGSRQPRGGREGIPGKRGKPGRNRTARRPGEYLSSLAVRHDWSGLA